MNYTNKLQVKDIIKFALNEDIGEGDITTRMVVGKDRHARAVLLAKENCVVCGLGVAASVFKTQDKTIEFKCLAREGQGLKKGKILARIKGKAKSILIAERVALNFLALLSGIATKTRKYVEAVRPYKVKIMDTRKTIPGLRELEKYAVRLGGGYNHRMRLDEAVLIKDNHLATISPKSQISKLKKVIQRIRRKHPGSIKIEVEVKNLKEFKEALAVNPDIVMLDNMGIKDMKRAVHLRNNLLPTTYNLRPKIEASGGITLKNIRAVAAAGVDIISIGDLTHSVTAVDISLEFLSP